MIAGGNGEGNQLNQLAYSLDFFIKNQISIFIADGDNYRIVELIIDEKQDTIRTGGNSPGHKLNQF